MADRVVALVVRQRPGCGVGRGRRASGQGPDGDEGDRAGRRRRDGRYRVRVSLGHVRAQRRRPVHLLRQRGLHEHRGAAVGGDPAGGADGDDRGGRSPPGELVRAGQEHARPGHGARHPLRRHGHGGRPARPRGEGDPCHVDPGRPLHPHPRAVPTRVGERLERHGSDRPPGHPDRALPRLRGRTRRGDRRDHHPPPGPCDGVPATPGPLRPPLRRARGTRRSPMSLDALQAMADDNIRRYGLEETDEVLA